MTALRAIPGDVPEQLSAALGADVVLAAPADMARYELGARYGTGRAAAVLRPRSTADVSRAVQVCVALGIEIVPQGANTGLVGASVPDPTGSQVVLSLERLRALFSIDSLNRTATVGAGVDLAALNAAAAEHGLMFPIDLGSSPSIGGLVATNAGGSRVLKYGDVRRNVLGLEAVLINPPGEVVDALSPLRKSSLGLDVKQIFIGTGGAFGIVTAATLALQPLPAATAAALVVPVGLDVVPDLLAMLRKRLGDRLSAFEGMSQAAMAAAVMHVPAARDPFAPAALPGHAILVEASSERASDVSDELTAAIESAFDAGLITDARFGPADRLWALRHAISEGLRLKGKVIGFDIALPLGAAARFRADVASEVLSRYPAFLCADFGHWGDGGEHLNFVYAGSDALDPAEVAGLRDAIYRLVDRHRGAFSAEHGLGPDNIRYYRRHVPLSWRRIASELKAVLDPASVLSRIDLRIAADDVVAS